MSAFSHCIHCGRRLRDAIFCPECGMSTCSWTCQAQHAAGHESNTEPLRNTWNGLASLAAGGAKEAGGTLGGSREA